MKASVIVAVAVAALFLVPGSCFALWDILTLSPDEAQRYGLEVRVPAANPEAVSIEIEFADDEDFRDFSEVELRLDNGDDNLITAPLREVRNEAGHVVVSFHADRDQLESLSVWIMVPGGSRGLTGGTAYGIPVNDFVE
jgi:hypothetical protein